MGESEGERISQARRRLAHLLGRDLLRADLAKLVEVQPSTVKSWEEGTKRPTDASRAVLAKVLGITEHYLRYGLEPMELPNWTPPDMSKLDAKKPAKVTAKRYPIRKAARPGTERRKAKEE